MTTSSFPLQVTAGNALAVKAIIAGTLLWGLGYAFEGACLLLNAAEWIAPGSDDLPFHIIMTFDDPIPALVGFALARIDRIQRLVSAAAWHPPRVGDTGYSPYPRSMNPSSPGGSSSCHCN